MLRSGSSIGNFSDRSRHAEQAIGSDEDASGESASNRHGVLEPDGDHRQNRPLLEMDHQYHQQRLKFRSTSSVLSEGRGQEPSPSSYGQIEVEGSVARARDRSYYVVLLSPTMRREVVAVILGTMLSWHVPRYLIQNEAQIALKRPPYQVLQTLNEVVLDPALNLPWIDPPTIPSNFLVLTSVGVPLLVVFTVACLWGRPAFAGCPPASETAPTTDEESKGAGTDGDDDAAALAAQVQQQQLLQQRRRWIHTMHAGVCGALTSIALSEGPTQLLKLYVQRRRPNFYSLCGFSMKTRECAAPDPHRIRDANFSFPSGHSSLAAAGMVYLSWFLLSRVVHSSQAPASLHKRCIWGWRTQRIAAFLCFAAPHSWCVFVGATRLADNWHHPSDVIAGLILGWTSATVAYHLWFPPFWVSPWPWSDWGDRKENLRS